MKLLNREGKTAMETPEGEATDANPENGNVPQSVTEYEYLNNPAMKEVMQKQEIAQQQSKFFRLNIGESVEVRIIPDKTEVFKVELKNHELAEKFRYYLYQKGIPDVVKAVDLWWSQSEKIVNELKSGHADMIIECIASKTRKNGNYVIRSKYDKE